MTESTSVLNTPVLWINKYLQEKLQDVLEGIVDFGTARTYAGNKIIIDYDYHQSTTRYRDGVLTQGILGN